MWIDDAFIFCFFFFLSFCFFFSPFPRSFTYNSLLTFRLAHRLLFPHILNNIVTFSFRLHTIYPPYTLLVRLHSRFHRFIPFLSCFLSSFLMCCAFFSLLLGLLHDSISMSEWRERECFDLEKSGVISLSFFWDFPFAFVWRKFLFSVFFILYFAIVFFFLFASNFSLLFFMCFLSFHSHSRVVILHTHAWCFFLGNVVEWLLRDWDLNFNIYERDLD